MGATLCIALVGIESLNSAAGTVDKGKVFGGGHSYFLLELFRDRQGVSASQSPCLTGHVHGRDNAVLNFPFGQFHKLKQHFS